MYVFMYVRNILEKAIKKVPKIIHLGNNDLRLIVYSNLITN